MQKIKSLLLILFLIPVVNVFAQKNEIINPENISAKKLKEIFENAYVTVSEEDPEGKFIKIKDGYDVVYMDISKDKKYITYSVVWICDPKYSERDKLDLVNLIAEKAILLSPNYSRDKDDILMKYDLYIEGGVTAKNIVLTEKKFVLALKLALDIDTRKVIK